MIIQGRQAFAKSTGKHFWAFQGGHRQEQFRRGVSTKGVLSDREYKQNWQAGAPPPTVLV